MKKFNIALAIFALLAMLPSQLFAQKIEGNDICRNDKCFVEIFEKLKSSDKTLVAEAEKELDVIAEYCKKTDDSEVKPILMKSILTSLKECDDCKYKDYLFSLLPRFCKWYDANMVIRLADDDKLADAAIRTVGDIPEAQDIIVKYVSKNKENLNHKAALAYAVGKHNITSMENDIITWLKGADDNTKIEIYKALLVVGSTKKALSIVEKGGKKLYRSDNVNYKIEGMRLLVAVKGEKCMPKLLKSLKNNDKRVRLEALELMKPFADDKICAKTVKIYSKDHDVTEVLNWLGEIKNDSQMEFVLNQLSSDNPKLVEAAIRAVFNIDNPDGIAVVKPMFGGKYQEVIKEEMVKYEGDYYSVLSDVIKGTDRQKLATLQIIEERPILETNRRVRELLYSDNEQVRDEAYKVLKYVVMPAHAEFLCSTLENCKDKYVEDVQIAIKNAMAKSTDSAKDNFISLLKYVKPEVMPRYYKVFAYFGTEFSVNKLIEAYKSGEYKEEAREALLLVENPDFKELVNETLK